MKKVIAIDVDGVLLDYNHSYAWAWEQAFGERPKVINKDAYWSTDFYDVPYLEPVELAILKSAMDKAFWENMRPLYGASNFLREARERGYSVIAVSAASPRVHEWRWKNLKDNFEDEIQGLICTGDHPKSLFINHMLPEFFFDDYAPFFDGVDSKVKKILVNRNPGPLSPNYEAKVGDFYRIIGPNLTEFIPCL